ncbi:hypothetical protein NQ317_013484 [Molorchus minor]|uniref:Uncharacterized protein n=1 Tax=Molorchus minor TaxID=1323400 RepID=A0ABQ9J9Y5_9CUCU|nr:hypothetical protein NQ317_013484 [Molorchus minor]
MERKARWATYRLHQASSSMLQATTMEQNRLIDDIKSHSILSMPSGVMPFWTSSNLWSIVAHTLLYFTQQVQSLNKADNLIGRDFVQILWQQICSAKHRESDPLHCGTGTQNMVRRLIIFQAAVTYTTKSFFPNGMNGDETKTPFKEQIVASSRMDKKLQRKQGLEYTVATQGHEYLDDEEFVICDCCVLENEISTLKKEVENLKNQIQQAATQTNVNNQSPIDNTEEMITEMMDRQNRMKNVIMYNIKEATQESYADRVKQDTETVHNILERMRIDKNNTKLFRLGKPAVNKTRPIKLILNSASDAKLTLKNKHLLTEQGIRVYNDQTKAQQKYFQKIKAELQELINLGDNSKSIKFINDSYHVHRKDRKFDVVNENRGGGVLIAVKNTIISESVDVQAIDLNFPLIDMLVVKCEYNTIVNNTANLLDLVISNVQCQVLRDNVPLVREDGYHPALIISIESLSSQKSVFSP